MTVISVIIGSTREGRFSEKPANWIAHHLRQRDDIETRLLDLRDFPLPFFDQPVPPACPADRLTQTKSLKNGPPKSPRPTASSSSPRNITTGRQQYSRT